MEVRPKSKVLMRKSGRAREESDRRAKEARRLEREALIARNERELPEDTRKVREIVRNSTANTFQPLRELSYQQILLWETHLEHHRSTAQAGLEPMPEVVPWLQFWTESKVQTVKRQSFREQFLPDAWLRLVEKWLDRRERRLKLRTLWGTNQHNFEHLVYRALLMRIHQTKGSAHMWMCQRIHPHLRSCLTRRYMIPAGRVKFTKKDLARKLRVRIEQESKTRDLTDHDVFLLKLECRDKLVQADKKSAKRRSLEGTDTQSMGTVSDLDDDSWELLALETGQEGDLWKQDSYPTDSGPHGEHSLSLETGQRGGLWKQDHALAGPIVQIPNRIQDFSNFEVLIEVARRLIVGLVTLLLGVVRLVPRMMRRQRPVMLEERDRVRESRASTESDVTG